VNCKLILLDEINCKLEGLDVTVRKKLLSKFSYELPYARHMPAVRLGRWNGKVAFFQLGGSTYTNLLPDILPELDKLGIDVEIEDRRNPPQDFQFQSVDKDSYSHICWPAGHVHAGMPIELRDYQVESINECLSNLQGILNLATGAGKTLITAVLSHKVEPYGRSVIIVPSKQLVEQTEEDYINLQLDVGVYYGDRKDIGKKHTICTWQSLSKLMKEGMDVIDAFLTDVVCVIGDECHGAKAEELKKLLTGPFGNAPIRWGLTGTIPKELFEFQALRISFGEVINRITASELQDKGVLANCHVQIKQTGEVKEYKVYSDELDYLLGDAHRLDWIAGVIEDCRVSGNVLVLVGRIDAGKELAKRVRDANFVSGAMKTTDRKEQYDEVRDATDKVIIATYGVAAVGINVPRIHYLILIEPGKSFVRVIQSIGRGLRKASDKDFVQIIDVTSYCKFSKRHLTKRKQFYKEAGYPYNVEKCNYPGM
jgi:superfamily II DNA or RNA helicase